MFVNYVRIQVFIVERKQEQMPKPEKHESKSRNADTRYRNTIIKKSERRHKETDLKPKQTRHTTVYTKTR